MLNTGFLKESYYKFLLIILMFACLLVSSGLRVNSQTTNVVVEQTEIHPSNLASEQGAAQDISLWGNRLIIGNSSGELQKQFVYIYERDASGTWNEVAILENPLNPTVSTLFGLGVGIWEDTAVVTALIDSSLAIESGAAFIYERDAVGSWNHTATLYGSNQVARDRFGYDVDIYENRLVVSASWQDTGAHNAGAVYIYERDASGTWGEVAFLIPLDIAVDDSFGRAVSIWQDTVIVTSWDDDDLGNSSGSAYIFERDALGNWNFMQKLLASDGSQDDHFGWSVDLIDNIAVVGAANASSLGQSSGAAYVFERDAAGNWYEVSRLTASDGVAGDYFGIAVAVSGNKLVVGAEDVDGNANESSAAYYFERDLSGNWMEVEKFAPIDFQEDHNFGRSVSMFGDWVAIGAMFDNDIVYRGGSTYIFTLEAVALNPVFSSIPVTGNTITLTGETGTTQFATLSISNIGDAGSLLDVTQVGTLSNFSIGALPQDLLPADGTVSIEVSCVVPQASETLVLQTNETGNPTYSYTLECIANDLPPEITVEPPEEFTPEVNVNENPSNNAPQTSMFDPAISKIGFLLPGQVGVTGEQLEWIVTVSNTGNVVGQNVTVTDTLIDALRVDSVNAPGAVVSINGQTVTVTYPVLNVGETRQFSIITTVLQGVEVTNTACVNATNQTSPECATGNAIISLPQTGENPLWRNWFWLLLIVPLAGLASFRRKLQQR